jgi:transcriptional regulator with XRE-family HTH domain
MRALLHTEFDALLARAGVSQASFARLTGVTARQVNNWARGRAAVPKWAALLAVMLETFSPEALTISLEEAAFTSHEILGIPPNADAATARRAMTRLALRYHPDKGGRPEEMTRINAAYEAAQSVKSSGRSPAR